MRHSTSGSRALSVRSVLVLCAVLLPALVNAKSTVLVNQRQPFSIVLTDECTGEDVQIVAEDHVLIVQRTDKDGTVYWDESINTHGTAMGLTSGRQYVYNETIRFTRPAEPGPACGFSVDFSTRLRLVSKGVHPDLFVKYSLELDVSAGCVVIIDETLDSACRP